MKFLIYGIVFLASIWTTQGATHPDAEWIPRSDESSEGPPPEPVTVRPSWDLFPRTDEDSEFVPELLQPDKKPPDFDKRIIWTSSRDWVETDQSWIQMMYKRMKGLGAPQNPPEDFGPSSPFTERAGDPAITFEEEEDREAVENEVVHDSEERRKNRPSLKFRNANF